MSRVIADLGVFSRIGVRKGRWTMKTGRFFPRTVGSIFLSGVLLLACGGGGGDEGENLPPPQMPTTLNYNISTISGAPLTLVYPEGSATIDNIFLTGTIRTDNLAITTSADSRMILPSLIYQAPGATDNQFAPIVPWVQIPLSWGSSGYPTAGQVSFYTNVTGSDWVLMDVDPNIPPGGGVRLSNYLNFTLAGPPVSFDWESLIAVADNALAPLFERKASLGFSALAFGYEQAGTVIEWLSFLDNDANVARLVAAGAAGITESCDPRPDLAPRGTRKIVWLDNVADGSVGPGDNFTVTYSQCFVDDAGDDVDEILDGTIRMKGYILTDAPFAIGMEDVRFENFTRTETHSNPFTVTIHARVINGGQTFFFSQ
jgi:hypothetical protein